MTEHDSGSGSDSSSESASSSDSASGGGLDLSPIVQNLLDDALEPRRSSPIGPPLPPEGERERRAQYEKTLKEILFSTEPIPDTTSLVRRVVETEHWFLPIAPDGDFERLAGSDTRAQRALTRPLAHGEPERRPGRGSRPPTELILAMSVDPGRPARQLTGRELAHAVPPDAAGAIFVFDTGGADDAVGLRREELPLLTQLADSLDLEQLLVEPGPGQVKALQAARWYVPVANEQLAPSPPGWGDPTVNVYTHPDRAEAEHAPMIELDGLTLCKQLGNRGDYVGLSVNAGSPVGTGDQETRALMLGPSFARDIVRGVDPRRGAGPLPARTLAEALLWLDLEGFPWEHREIVLAPASYAPPENGAVMIQVRSKKASTWRIYETSYAQPERRGPTVSPVFAVARPETLPATLPAPVPPAFLMFRGEFLNRDVSALTSEAIDLGEGQTKILCAGLLARKLYEQDHWAPSGWFVSKQERLRAAQLAGWAHELLKLIPPGADRLPHSAVLSVKGASILHTRPDFSERAWIEKQHRRHAPGQLLAVLPKIGTGRDGRQVGQGRSGRFQMSRSTIVSICFSITCSRNSAWVNGARSRYRFFG